jgi:diacylglycerol kinase (ATP)
MWLIFFNPTSGGGNGERLAEATESMLKKRNHPYLRVSGINYRDAQEKFHQTLGEYKTEISGVIVVGGDGMVHLAIQELAHTSVPMALVPAGTGNDFARALGLNLKKPLAILDQALTTTPRAVDLGKVQNEYFAAILSTGFDSIVNERANKLTFIKGRMKYNIAIALVLSTFRPKNYKFRIDSVDFTTEAMLIAVSNGLCYGGGMKVAPHARIDDGLLDIMILGPISKIEFLKVFPRVFTGSHISHPAVKIIQGKSVEISSDAIAYADGERVGPLPIAVNVQSQALLTWSA